MNRLRFNHGALQTNPDALIALIEAQMSQLSDSLSALRAVRTPDEIETTQDSVPPLSTTSLRAFIVGFMARAKGPVMNADIIANLPENLIRKTNHTEVLVSQTLRRMSNAGMVKKLGRGLWVSAIKV